MCGTADFTNSRTATSCHPLFTWKMTPPAQPPSCANTSQNACCQTCRKPLTSYAYPSLWVNCSIELPGTGWDGWTDWDGGHEIDRQVEEWTGWIMLISMMERCHHDIPPHNTLPPHTSSSSSEAWIFIKCSSFIPCVLFFFPPPNDSSFSTRGTDVWKQLEF